MKTVRAIIFDLDGTLVDTIKDIASSVNASLKSHSLPSHQVGDYRSFLGHGSKVLIEKAIGEKDSPIFNDVFDDYKQDYATNVVVFSKPYKNMTLVLKHLKACGYKLAVLTNKPQDLADSLIDSVFPENTFDAVIGVGEGILPKPHMSGFDKIVELLEVSPSEVMYVGDSEVDIEMAKLAQVSVQVSCTYGYVEKEELENHKPQYLIEKPLDLLKIISKVGVYKTLPHLTFDILSVVGFMIPTILGFIFAYFYGQNIASDPQALISYGIIAYTILFYFISYAVSHKINRYIYVISVSAFLIQDFLYLLIREISVLGSSWTTLFPLIYLAGTIIFSIVVISFLVGCLIHLLKIVKKNNTLKQYQKTREHLIEQD